MCHLPVMMFILRLEFLLRTDMGRRQKFHLADLVSFFSQPTRDLRAEPSCYVADSSRNGEPEVSPDLVFDLISSC